jgi:hypothetical protein
MIYNKSDSQTYIQEFKKRFSNFAEKAPVLLSYSTTPTSVQIINETTNDVFEIGWDYMIPVKTFIYGIKQMLIDRDYYPIIHKIEEEPETVSTEEQISMAASGTDLGSIPVKRYKKYVRKLLIDKIIVFKDIFIIKDLETGEMSRWKMNKSCVFFLKKIREGKLNKEQAGSYFFENSILLNIILPNDERAEDSLLPYQ